MHNLFISSLSAPLSSWLEAFPDAICVNAIAELTLDPQVEAVFWLHKNSSSGALKLQDDQEVLSQLITTILSQHPFAKIVVLANSPSQADSVQSLRFGALGYCHAYSDAAVLKEICEVISRGGLWIGQDFLRRLIESSTKLLGSESGYIDGLLAKLTAREQEVALEAAKGFSNKEIARHLKITERTVKAHLAKVFERLGARDRLQLALMLNKK